MIQFSINKSYFLQALNATKRAISSKNAIPILSSLKIEVGSHSITLTGSNGQISIENTISANEADAGLLISSGGSILLEANFFINVISSLPEVSLDFEEIEQQQVLLKSGKSEITLKGKDVEQYPRLQEMTTSNPLVLETKLLKTLVAETAFAASTQESRPILTGVHLSLTDHKDFKAVATDSHRMSQRLLRLENATDNFDVVILFVNLQRFSQMISKQLKYSFRTVKFFLEVRLSLSIPVF